MRHDPGYYARQAQEVLEKQHTRVLQAAEALMQHVSFIRESDVTPEEWRLYQEAQHFLESRRKPPTCETAAASESIQELRRA